MKASSHSEAVALGTEDAAVPSTLQQLPAGSASLSCGQLAAGSLNLEPLTLNSASDAADVSILPTTAPPQAVEDREALRVGILQLTGTDRGQNAVIVAQEQQDEVKSLKPQVSFNV